MIFSQDRDQLRAAYFAAWNKARADQPLEPLEQQIVEVITEHPEYHALLEDEATAIHKDFSPEAGESNPFLHMALHIAIREQLATDRPIGIQKAYRKVRKHSADVHKAEHRIMECLGHAIWEIQRYRRPFNEAAYLQCVRKAAKR